MLQVEASGPFPISYTIYSGDPDHLFTIEPTTGKIIVSRYLDADKWGSILLNIQVIHPKFIVYIYKNLCLTLEQKIFIAR